MRPRQLAESPHVSAFAGPTDARMRTLQIAASANSQAPWSIKKRATPHQLLRLLPPNDLPCIAYLTMLCIGTA
jgi:hypothetical protein